MTIEQATIQDTEAITQFQVDMAAESETATLNRELVIRSVTEGLKDVAKGIYLVARNDVRSSCCLSHAHS